MESYKGEGCLTLDFTDDDEQLVATAVNSTEQVSVSKRYGWSTHNCSCSGSKTGLVLYPTDTQYKNIVLLVCEKHYKYEAGNGTQHDQLEKWYFGIYGTTKSFRFVSGFSMKNNGELGFNSSSKNSASSAYHTTNREMGKIEQSAVRAVVKSKLKSYEAR